MAKEKPLGMDTISFTAENPRKKKRKSPVDVIAGANGLTRVAGHDGEF